MIPQSGNHLRRQRGVTLIELMVVVVIIGVLAAVAIPSYSKWVKKSRRQLAGNCLLDLQGRMEGYYQRRSAYPTSLVGLGLTQPYSCPESDYQASLSADSPSCTAPACYDLRATATGGQAADGILVLQYRYSANPNTRLTKQRIMPDNSVKAWTD